MDEGIRWTSHRRYLYLLSKALFFGGILYLGYLLFEDLSRVLIPLGLSFLIAYLLDPAVDWFEQRGINRTLAIFIILLAVLAGLGVFTVVIAPTLTEEVTIMVTERFPRFGKTLSQRYFQYQQLLSQRTGFVLPESVPQTFEEYGQRIQELASDMVQRVTSFTGDVLVGTVGVVTAVINVLLVPLFVFYFLRDFDRLKGAAFSLVPLPHRELVLAKARRIDRVVGGWFRGQLTVAVILGVLYATGLVICGVKLGLAIGLLAGALAIVPYLGFVIGITIALLMSIVDEGAGWGQTVGVLITFTSVQILDAYFITPRVVGDRVGLPPVMVIVVILMGAELFGFFGVILAVPTAAIIRVLLLDAIADYKRSRTFLGEDNFLRLMAYGPNSVGADVREALKEAAEADLDMDLPSPLSQEEVARMSVELMKTKQTGSYSAVPKRREDRSAEQRAAGEEDSASEKGPTAEEEEPGD